MKRFPAHLKLYPVRLTPATASLLLFLAVLITFSPVRHFEYLSIDDKMHTEHNEKLAPFTWANLKSFWSAPYEHAYTPLTYSTWMVAATLAKNKGASPRRFDPGVFHLTNVLFHGFAVIAVFLFLTTLCRNRFAALLGAMLFAFHPLQVESVCWITGLRDVMAGAFAIFSAALYFQFQHRAGRKGAVFYGAALVFYLAAVLCKSSALVTPLVIGLLSFAVFKRRPLTLMKELAPWLLLSLPLINIFIKLNDGLAREVVYSPSPFGRLVIAIDSLSFYLRKVFVPYPLLMDYARTPQWVLFQSRYHWTILGTTLALFAAFRWSARKRAHWFPISFLVFLISLSPLLGLQSFVFQHISTVADRYAYLALTAPSLAMAWVLSRRKSTRNYAIAGTLIVICWAITLHQTRMWKSNEALFSHNLRFVKDSWISSNNLGAAYESQGKWLAARELYFKAAEIANIPSSWNNFGAMSIRLKDYPAAITAFHNAMIFSDRSPWAALNLSTAYARAGNLSEAKRYLKESLEKNPSSALARENARIIERHEPVSSLKLLRASGEDT